MIKIAIAGWYPSDPEHIPGGPYYASYVQVQTLREHSDVDVYVVSRSKEIAGYKQLDLDGVHLNFIGEPKHRILPRQITAINSIANILKKIKPDVVVSHDYTETLASIKAGYRTAHFVHGIPKCEMKYARPKDKLQYWLQTQLNAKALRSVSDIICISDYGVQACKNETHANIHRIAFPAVEDLFFRSSEYTSGKAILFAGVIYPLKNLMALLKCMPIILRSHPDAKLRICGKVVDSKYMASIQEYILRENIQDNIEFLGLITRQEILDNLSDSVCLALPSLQENTPVVIAQAMAAGRAVIASPVGGIPEMVEDGVNGYLVKPEDTEIMAKRIISLLDDKDLTQRMGNASYDKARNVFERHVHVDQLLSICRGMLGQ